MRTSDWNGPAALLTCVTTGMISALPGGSALPPRATGVTRLTETGVLIGAPLLGVTVTVPVFAPGGRLTGCAVTVSVVPLGANMPLCGVTVRKLRSVVALNVESSAVLL